MVDPNDVFGVIIDEKWHPIVERVEHVNGVQDVWKMVCACGLAVYEKRENFSTDVRWHAQNAVDNICGTCAQGPQP